MKKGSVKLIVLIVVIVVVIANIGGWWWWKTRPCTTSPEDYKKLSTKFWTKIYNETSPAWRVEEKVNKDVTVFENSGETDRKKMFEYRQKKLGD